MRILIALTYYRPHYSGLTIYTERVARALAKRGHQVTILTSRFDKSLVPREHCDGVEIVRPNVWGKISKGVIMPAMPILAWKLARQADVVHLHAPQLDAAYIALLSRLFGKPVVLTYHCDLRLPVGCIHFIANKFSNLANHITAMTANVVVHNTRDYAENSPFLRRYLHKLLPVYPPVEVSPITATDLQVFRQKYDILPGQRLIGVAARLATEKGIEYLAQALVHILDSIPLARVLFVGPYQDVVGETEYASRLASLIGPLKEHWTFLGVLPPIEMAAFFHECEVTVLPSINSTESYGMVQVESMACGTPVVASNLPGVRVPILETSKGRLAPPGNADELARALIAILEDPLAYRGKADDLIRLSTPEAVAMQYEMIFGQIQRQ